MSVFLNAILPSCCTKRLIKKENNSTISTECDEISKLDISAGKYYDQPQKYFKGNGHRRNYENDLSLENTENSYRLTRGSTLASTHSIENACQVLEQFQCVICNQPSQGFCIGCQNSRYCKECYEKAHKNKYEGHKFCNYTRKKFKSASNAIRTLARLGSLKK